MGILGLIISIIGIALSVVSIILTIKIYKKQCKHIYKLNYNKIAYSSLSQNIMDLQLKITNEIEACIHDIQCFMKNGNYSKIQIEDEINGYVDRLSSLISNYTMAISDYIDAALQCNEYKKREDVRKSINTFESNLDKLHTKCLITKFKNTDGKFLIFTLQPLNPINNRLIDCIYSHNLDIESFKYMMNDLEESVRQAQQVNKDIYKFTIQSIKDLLNTDSISKELYECDTNMYKHVME